jgi:hypothetical protein
MPLAGTANAVTLRTHVLPIYQIGTGSQVSMGHTAIATTNYNRLYAGGTYQAVCASSEMLATSGQRFFTSEGTIGGTAATVTIPAIIPARIGMPGFDAAAMRGRRIDCTYNWTTRAVESNFTIGAGGVGFTIGGGERNEGGTQIFTMSVPSLGDDSGSTCIP